VGSFWGGGAAFGVGVAGDGLVSDSNDVPSDLVGCGKAFDSNMIV
jgi:hypothetical protein